jgi:hypothetical protein
LKRIIARALVLVALSIGGVVSLGAPAEAKALANCYSHSICAFNTLNPPPLGTVIMPNRDVADAPRNQCFADFGSYQTLMVTNNSGFRWYLFRTSACTGSHIEVAPYDEIVTPSGWDQIHAWFRTSTTS